ELRSPPSRIAFRNYDARVSYHVGYLTGATCDDRNTACERLDDHPPELLLPTHCGLTGYGEHIHRPHVARNFIVAHKLDAYTRARVAFRGPGAKGSRLRAGTKKKRAPRLICGNLTERVRQHLDALCFDQAPDKADNRRLQSQLMEVLAPLIMREW